MTENWFCPACGKVVDREAIECACGIAFAEVSEQEIESQKEATSEMRNAGTKTVRRKK